MKKETMDIISISLPKNAIEWLDNQESDGLPVARSRSVQRLIAREIRNG